MTEAQPKTRAALWLEHAWMRARDRALGIVAATGNAPPGSRILTDGRGTFVLVAPDGKHVGGCRIVINDGAPGFETWIGEMPAEEASDG